MALAQVAPGVHVVDRPLRFAGVQVGARMTVLQIGQDLLLHSPIDVDPADLAHLGTPRWLLSPNNLHHLYAGPWLERGLQGWCAPGLREKRPQVPWAHVVDAACEPIGPDVRFIPLSCFSLTNEVVVLHRPSRTLVVTDLVVNFDETAPLWTKVSMAAAWAYPGCKTSVLERAGMDRAVARRELRELLALDFDRVIPSHGHVVETGGKDALRAAFSWLGAL
jgi:hypothetical protein